jgi:O-succinylhomoserine sulfhydrylase
MSDERKKSNLENAQLATQLVHGGNNRSLHGETSEALYLTSGYSYPDAETNQARMAGDEPGFVYGRYGNPTMRMLEEKLAMLEGAEACRCTSSGMAAISASMLAPCQQGDRIVAAKALFGSCTWILKNLAPKYGIETEFVDGHDLDAWKQALSKPARLVLIESPSNRVPMNHFTTLAPISITVLL